MSEEINYILESLRFKTSIYRDKHKRNLTFNDDEYYSNILNEYIEDLQQENQELKEKLNCDLKWALKYDELYKQNQQLKEDIKDLDNQKEMMFKNMQLNQLKVCELAKVLDEIREYIKGKLALFPKGLVLRHLGKDYLEDLLQILDKVKE